MLELQTEAISKAARVKMAMRMKKLAPKIARKKAIAAKKMASSATLKTRSEKAARSLIMKKVTKGIDKSALSMAQKEKIEKIMRKKKAAVSKLAKKLFPKVKAKEKERMEKVRAEDGKT